MDVYTKAEMIDNRVLLRFIKGARFVGPAGCWLGQRRHKDVANLDPQDVDQVSVATGRGELSRPSFIAYGISSHF
jgi:hypothetical protein